MTLADRLRAADPDVRVTAIGELVARGAASPAELDALSDCLGHVRKAVQRPAAEAFVALEVRGAAVRAVLERALASPVLRQRWGAAFALSRGGDPPAETVPVLLEVLGADDGDMRWAAAGILLAVRDRETVVAALHRVLGAHSAAQRKMALYCLRDIGTPSAAAQAAAVRALGDEEESVRLAAMAALARLAVDRAAAAEHLVAALETSTERIRRAAAAALGALGDCSPRVVAALRTAAASSDAALGRAAAGALKALSVR